MKTLFADGMEFEYSNSHRSKIVELLRSRKAHGIPDIMFFRKVVDRYSNPEGVAVDIGAGIGLSAIRYGSYFRKVYAVEPYDMCRKYLESNVENNCKDGNVEVVDLYFGATVGGQVILNPLVANSASFKVSYEGKGAGIKKLVVPFDQWWASLGDQGPLSFVRICNGGDISNCVFGMKNVIDKCRPVLQVTVDDEEVSRCGRSGHEVISYIESNGYVSMSRELRQLAPYQRVSKDRGYLPVFFLPKERV